MKTVAFVTSDQYPDLTPDDRLALEPLKGYGIKAAPTVWDDPSVRWETFDHIILRSPWDYSFKGEKFLKWIKMLEDMKLSISNPYPILYWNMNKSYLKEIEQKGFPVIPTVFARKGSPISLEQLLKRELWEEAVIKPVVSAGGHKAWRTSMKTASHDQKRLQAMLLENDLIIQKFMNTVILKGEWSFVFFNGQWSHAVLKHPREGEFRVQERFGGFLEKKKPSASLVLQAKKLIDSFAAGCLYARVDGIEVDGNLCLMELELLEPALLLSCDASAPERFASAIKRLLLHR